MSWAPLVIPVVTALAYLAILPLVGAGLLLLSYRVTRLQPLSFGRGWKVYLAAVSYGMICNLIVGSALCSRQQPDADLLLAQVVVGALTQLLAVAFLLRRYTARDLLAQGTAVLATNLAGVALLVLINSGYWG